MRQITKLDNGLIIASDTMKDVESVSMNVWVTTGSIYETAAQGGISHFVEHMAFKGTETRNATQIAEAFENMGAYFNAFTSKFSTYYFAKALKNDTEKCLDILADIIQNSVFDAHELETERTVILQELALDSDNPQHLIGELFALTTFGDTPLGRPIIGTEANIKRFSRDNLLDYVHNKYNSQNIIISIAGNIQHEVWVELAQRYFNHLSTGDKNVYPQFYYQGGEQYKNKDLEQVNMVLGFEGVPHQSPDYYAADILAAILGGGASSRLFQEVREKRGLVYTISSSHSGYRDLGSFKIYAGMSPDKTNETLKLICQELKKVMEGITEVELQRAITQNKVDLLMGKELTDYRAGKLSSDLGTFDRIIDEAEMVSKYEAVTLEDRKSVV